MKIKKKSVAKYLGHCTNITSLKNFTANRKLQKLLQLVLIFKRQSGMSRVINLN